MYRIMFEHVAVGFFIDHGPNQIMTAFSNTCIDSNLVMHYDDNNNHCIKTGWMWLFFYRVIKRYWMTRRLDYGYLLTCHLARQYQCS